MSRLFTIAATTFILTLMPWVVAFLLALLRDIIVYS